MDKLENKINQGKRLLFSELKALFKRPDAEVLFGAYLAFNDGYFGAKEEQLLLISQPNATALFRAYLPWNSLIPEVQVKMIRRQNAKELLSAYQESYVLCEEAQIALLRSKNAEELLRVFIQKFKLDFHPLLELVQLPKAKAKALIAIYTSKYLLDKVILEKAQEKGLL